MRAPGKLYVVTAVYNPIRYRSRYKLYKEFAKRVADAGAELYTVEAAFHDRDFYITRADDPKHIQVRTSHELWVKENLWNVGISRLPADAEYVATVDADFDFARPDWAEETVHQLQHHRVVQMFTNITYLDPEHTVHMVVPGFAFMHRQTNNFFKVPHHAAAKAKQHWCPTEDPYGGNFQKAVVNAAPGGAWAYRREDLSRCGMLLDTGILGSSDYYMALAMVGYGAKSVASRDFHPEYKQSVADWARRAERWFRRDVGYVPGTATHFWHGKMAKRGYGHRDEILVRHQFNPRTDLKKDWQGVYQLEDDGSVRFAQMRDAIRDYFRLRSEDSIDM